jgi:hypothetical protein
MYSQKWNCSASFPIPTFMYLWAIYTFSGSVCLFGCNKIGRLILGIINRSQIHECGNWETEHYNSVLKITRPCSLFLGIHKLEPDIYIEFSPALHLQCKVPTETRDNWTEFFPMVCVWWSSIAECEKRRARNALASSKLHAKTTGPATFNPKVNLRNRNKNYVSFGLYPGKGNTVCFFSKSIMRLWVWKEEDWC